MKKIIIATKNIGKVKDFEELFSDNVKVTSLLDFPSVKDIKEDGSTFQENAIKKAEEISEQFNEVVIADDSGLCIDALNGRPGVYSARYAGEGKDNQANMEKVLTELEGVSMERREARFHCALAIAVPGKKTIVVEGLCEGRITFEPIGQYGFGYDPIFYIQEKQKTMAQLTKKEKNEISHRRRAMDQLRQVLDEIL